MKCEIINPLYQKIYAITFNYSFTPSCFGYNSVTNSTDIILANCSLTACYLLLYLISLTLSRGFIIEQIADKHLILLLCQNSSMIF